MANSENQVVTLTMNPTVDKSSTVDQVMPDKKLRCAAPQWHPGGGGINVGRVVQRLGGDPLLLYTSGGAQGELMHVLLAENGTRQQPISINGRTRQSLKVREEESDQQFRFNFPGPELSQQEWKHAIDAVRALRPTPAYLVLSGGLPPGVPANFYARLIEQMDRQRTRIIVDTHDAPLKAAVDAGVFLIKPNLRELRTLVGDDLAEEEAQETAVMDLVESGKCRAVVLSLSAAGALLATEDGVERLRAPTVKIRSKVGAGDSMVGGITWRLAQGASIRDATRYGIAAGAAAVTTSGTELCHPEKVAELYESMVNDQ